MLDERFKNFSTLKLIVFAAVLIVCIVISAIFTPIYYNKKKYKKNIVILTQPLEYRKKSLSKLKEILIKLKYRKYPNLLNTMFNRYKVYNKTIDDIIEMENKGEIFVIRPPKRLNIKLNENNPERFQEIYDLGVNSGKKVLKKLKKYLDE